jgi:ABC-type glycerol-3-phosphate transport system permease component
MRDIIKKYIVPIPRLVSIIGLATFVAQSILGSNEISQVTLCAGTENPDPELTSWIIRLIIIALGAVVVKRSVINSDRDIDTPQIPPNGRDLPSLSSNGSSYDSDSDSSLSDDVDPETVMTLTEAGIAIGKIAAAGIIFTGGTLVGTLVICATVGYSMIVIDFIGRAL